MADTFVAFGGHVVSVGDVQRGFRWITLCGQAIQCIVGVSRNHTSGVGFLRDVAGRVVGKGAGPGVWADLLSQVAEAVVLISRGDAAQVLDFGEVVLGVVFVAGDAV